MKSIKYIIASVLMKSSDIHIVILLELFGTILCADKYSWLLWTYRSVGVV